MNPWLLAWALGWVAIGWYAAHSRTAARKNRMRREERQWDGTDMVSIRCAPTSKLPRAWTVRR